MKGAKPPQILITDFRINNQIAQPGIKSSLKEALWKIKEINLNYDQDIFLLILLLLIIATLH